MSKAKSFGAKTFKHGSFDTKAPLAKSSVLTRTSLGIRSAFQGLEPEEYQRAKFEAKGRAVDLWNSLDQSNRKRVGRIGPEIFLRLPSSSETASEEIDSTQEA